MAQVEVEVTIGGRTFAVACQAGEEAFVQAAAGMLNTEATVLVNQTGRIPAEKMLLLAGLMLADRTGGLEERLREAEAQMTALSDELRVLRNAPPPEPQRVEVPVIPDDLQDALAEMTARAEALADAVEEKTATKSG